MSNAREVRCIGYGAHEGRCATMHDGKRNPVWCDRCNAIRLAYLNERFATLAKRFREGAS